ncbi:hypothetical protein ACFZAC_09165 [Pseudomonas fluorescens]|uniref:hypothetical protein n=1 Tax=Pseudomonas fluorescens TaxID=294 RepID=UPI0037481D6C
MSAQQKKHPFDFKTQYGLGFSSQDDEIVVDFFCGTLKEKLAKLPPEISAVWFEDGVAMEDATLSCSV